MQPDYRYSGNVDEGAGSDEPGCVAELGSDASIDSSLPRSALASLSSGFFLTFNSSSRSGDPDRVAGGAFRSFSLVIVRTFDFTGNSPPQRARNLPRSAFHRPNVRPSGLPGLPTGNGTIVL